MPERHPITYPMTLDLLAEKVAQLWDQVWWLSLTQEERDRYLAEELPDGEKRKPPITQFYIPIEEPKTEPDGHSTT